MYVDAERSYGYFRLPTVIDRLYCHDEEPELSSRSVSTTIFLLVAFTFTKQVSAAWEKVIPMKEEERVSVYISQPVPCRYSFCHCFMSVLEGTALMANKLDIMLLNPAARQDWAMKPSLNSAWNSGEMTSHCSALEW